MAYSVRKCNRGVLEFPVPETKDFIPETSGDNNRTQAAVETLGRLTLTPVRKPGDLLPRRQSA